MLVGVKAAANLSRASLCSGLVRQPVLTPDIQSVTKLLPNVHNTANPLFIARVAVVGNVFLGITTGDMMRRYGLDVENCEQEAGRRTPRANTKRKRSKYSPNPPDENNSQAITYTSRKYAHPYNIVNIAQPQYCQGQPSHISAHKQQFVGYFIYSLLNSPGGPATAVSTGRTTQAQGIDLAWSGLYWWASRPPWHCLVTKNSGRDAAVLISRHTVYLLWV